MGDIFADFWNFNKFSVLKIESTWGVSGPDLILDATFVPQNPGVKKAKKRRFKKSWRVKVDTAKMTQKSSENPAPDILRCRNCFNTHFPNRKSCKSFMLRKGIHGDKNENELAA